jgi:hypothetical protein
MEVNKKQPIPVNIYVPNVNNSMLLQKINITGLNVQTAAISFMSCALCVVIDVILVERNLFKKM